MHQNLEGVLELGMKYTQDNLSHHDYMYYIQQLFGLQAQAWLLKAFECAKY